MQAPASTNSLFRFGIYELDKATGELRKDGKVFQRVQGQPLEMLLLLLKRPGELVTREEMRQQLWPVDTFVDFDHSLNTAIGKLREALNDTAANPRFIQTIPRRGYRFVAPVTVVGPTGTRGDTTPIDAGAATPVSEALDADSERRARVLSDAQDLPAVAPATTKLLFSLLQVMYLGFYIAYLVDLRQTESLFGDVLRDPRWAFVLLLLAAAAGIPVRLYLLSAALFSYRRLTVKFLKIFPAVFVLDELWALTPFLLVDWIGRGLALAATAMLLFLPFSQRSLLLMGSREKSS